MDKILKLTFQERSELFSEVASTKGLKPVLIEKDFWVCYILDKLFQSERLKDVILFKGGTSLSKVFSLIDRFSEDIDLILDWTELTDENPNDKRTNTQQNKFNEKLRILTADYLEKIIAPLLRDILGVEFKVKVEKETRSINIQYPTKYKDQYVSSVICLEIGAIASWIPQVDYTIQSFAEEIFPDQFTGKKIKIKAIKAERTFWEKITILHREAYRQVGSFVPSRHSRHYYDVVLISKSSVKESAFKDLELLSDVVKFKDKFYHSAEARYDLAKLGTIKLMPPKHCIDTLKKDYVEMREMIFGDPPSFEELMSQVEVIESEINNLP